MAVPNIFATKPAGNVPASELDENYAYFSVGLPGITADVVGTGIPGLDDLADGWMLFSAPTVAGTDNPVDVLRAQRNSNYAGGTTGFVRSAFHALNHNQNAGNEDFEWAITAETYNSATTTGSQNGAALLYARKMVTGGGITFGAGITAEDQSGDADPTNALVGAEIDVYADGTDANSKRLALLLIVGTNSLPGYTKCFAEYAILTGPTNGNAAVGQFNTQFKALGTGVTGIDFTSVTFSGNAWQSDGATISGDGDVLSEKSLGFGSGGTYAAGTLSADADHGVILRAATDNPITRLFMFADHDGVGYLQVDNSGNWTPVTDSIVSSGASGKRWSNVFSVQGDFSSTLTALNVTVGGGGVLTLGNVATTGLTPGVLAASTDASILISDGFGTVYRVPCVV